MSHDSDIDDLTPPLGHVDDPAQAKINERLWRRIEFADRERAKGDDEILDRLNAEIMTLGKAVSDKTHKLGDRITEMSEQAVEHSAVDAGQFKKLEGDVTGVKDAVRDIKDTVRDAITSSKSMRNSVIGMGLGILVTVISAWIVLHDRVTAVETRDEAIRHDVDRFQQTLDKIDDKLQNLSDRMPNKIGTTP